MSKELINLPPSAIEGLSQRLDKRKPGGLAPFRREIYVGEYAWVGMRYREKAEQVILAMEPDTVLKVRREPKNEYDDGAVSVYYGTTKLGYISKSEKKILSHLMDAGKGFVGRYSGRESVEVGSDGKQMSVVHLKLYMLD